MGDGGGRGRKGARRPDRAAALGSGEALLFSQGVEDNFSSICHGPSIVWICRVKCRRGRLPRGKRGVSVKAPLPAARVGIEDAFSTREAPECEQPHRAGSRL